MTLQLTKKYNFDPVLDSQKVYRLILEAMSHPGRVVDMGEYTVLSVARTLLDNEVSFIVLGSPEFADEIASLTLAKQEPLESADYIFICDPGEMQTAIQSAKCGTLADPHKSATVVIQGSGLEKEATALRDAQNYEYPQGIDLLFISGAGELFAVPRLVAKWNHREELSALQRRIGIMA